MTVLYGVARKKPDGGWVMCSTGIPTRAEAEYYIKAYQSRNPRIYAVATITIEEEPQ